MSCSSERSRRQPAAVQPTSITWRQRRSHQCRQVPTSPIFRSDSISPNPRQPRTVFDEEAMDELVDSIREVGLLQPIVVRPLGGANVSSW